MSGSIMSNLNLVDSTTSSNPSLRLVRGLLSKSTYDLPPSTWTLGPPIITPHQHRRIFIESSELLHTIYHHVKDIHLKRLFREPPIFKATSHMLHPLKPPTFPLFKPPPMYKIWQEIVYWRTLIYPELNEMTIDKYYPNYPTKFHYAQIPGIHMLVGYTYSDLLNEFNKYTGEKYIDTNNNDVLEYWFYRKFSRVISRFVLCDYFGIRRKAENYTIKLQSIILGSDLSFYTIYTSILFPLFIDKDKLSWNVCVKVGLSDGPDFMFAVWDKIDNREIPFDWTAKVPVCVRPCTNQEIQEYSQ